MSQSMLPSTKAKNITVNGRNFTATMGTPVIVADQDASILSANGWLYSSGAQSLGAGTTANRPTTGLIPGATYTDSTLGYTIVYDGATWRHQNTGASV